MLQKPSSSLEDMFRYVETIADEAALWMEAANTRDTEAREGKFLAADLDAPMRPFITKLVGEGEESGQVPSWLDRSAAMRERINVVHNATFFKHKGNLPIYNSIAFEGPWPQRRGTSFSHVFFCTK